jgi:hypothetical protein
MQIQNTYYSYNTQRSEAQRVKPEADAAKQGTAGQDAVKAERTDSFERSKAFEAASASADAKAGAWVTDSEKVATMKAELAKNVGAFKQMVQALLQKQGAVAGGAMDALIQIDQQTQLSAQEAISENGYWGVTQTSDRIVDFAKALSGGDASKVPLLRDAVLAAFAEVEKIWGGELPEISLQTRDRIMAAFDEWENPTSSGDEAAETGAADADA